MKAKPSKHVGQVVLELDKRDEPMLTAAAVGPFRINRILVPIDFSDCATKALRYAVPLAKQHGASLDLVHVISSAVHSYGEYGPIWADPIENELPGSKKALQELAEGEIREVPFNVEVRIGVPHLEITQFAQSEQTDLIVIATHGYTGFKHALLGSVAENVVRFAPCPVLVVKVQEREFVRN
jgi:universal stress protein A